MRLCERCRLTHGSVVHVIEQDHGHGFRLCRSCRLDLDLLVFDWVRAGWRP